VVGGVAGLPAARRRLEQVGLSRLLAMAPEEVRAFFDAFFAPGRALDAVRVGVRLDGRAGAGHDGRLQGVTR
jgi:hypothetical protein